MYTSSLLAYNSFRFIIIFNRIIISELAIDLLIFISCLRLKSPNVCAMLSKYTEAPITFYFKRCWCSNSPFLTAQMNLQRVSPLYSYKKNRHEILKPSLASFIRIPINYHIFLRINWNFQKSMLQTRVIGNLDMESRFRNSTVELFTTIGFRVVCQHCATVSH